MKTYSYIASTPDETKKIASDLASTFVGGEVILASGEMGAGKTCFCQGIGRALGVKRIINSPTFNLVKVYKGEKFELYHVDCYRLEGVEERKKDLGLDEILGDENKICYIEWPVFGNDDILHHSPVIKLNITYLDDDRRKIVIEDERE